MRVAGQLEQRVVGLRAARQKKDSLALVTLVAHTGGSGKRDGEFDPGHLWRTSYVNNSPVRCLC